MSLSLVRSIIVGAAIVLIATPALAEGRKADYGRPGWYLGGGFGASWDFLEDAVEDVGPPGFVDVGTGWSAHARGGYRLTSWFALEAMYEGMYDLNLDIAGVESISTDFHSLMGNFKLIAPTWRLQPYFMLGLGAQGGYISDDSLIAPGFSRWDFLVRPALGIDGYITENWILNLELGLSFRVADYNEIPSKITDNLTLTLGVGVQYRF